ncbi:MAG: hypothetical protein ACRCWG_10935 [Sarcina sp.]
MNKLREENLEVVGKKLDDLFEIIGAGFRSPYELCKRSELPMMKDEIEEQFEDDDETIEFLLDEKICIVGFLDVTGEQLFANLDEENSPIYMYDEDHEYSKVFTLENYGFFAKSVFEIDKSELSDKEKYEKIESLAEELFDNGVDDMLCWKLQSCYRY